MSRPLRLEFPGAVYHVTSGGNARQRIYRDDAGREQFLRMVINEKVYYGLVNDGMCLITYHLQL